MSSATSALLGAVVFCWFPENDNPHVPGPKFRPAMVLEVDAVNRRLLVAYGTSQRTHENGRGEFTLTRNQLPGLQKDTKFCFLRRVWLPIDPKYFFGPRETGLSVIGFVPMCQRGALARRLEEAFMY